MRTAVLFAFAVAIAAAVACGTSDDAPAGDPTTNLAPRPATTGPAGSGLITGLPCGVQAVLENRCVACHSGTTAGAPRLLEYADLIAPSKADPTNTMAQAALIRMRSTTSPMPPPPAVPPNTDEINTFETWIILGTTKSPEACTDPPPPPPSGGKPPIDPASIKCGSGKAWTGGNTASPLMHPGGACNACHQVMGGPNLDIAGTVYLTSHEPDDCNGSAPPPALTVTITDAKSHVLNLTVNAAGNFDLAHAGKLMPPFKASVTNGTKTNSMVGSVTSGDCNSCHTVSGANGAPGRILAP